MWAPVGMWMLVCLCAEEEGTSNWLQLSSVQEIKMAAIWFAQIINMGNVLCKTVIKTMG